MCARENCKVLPLSNVTNVGIQYVMYLSGDLQIDCPLRLDARVSVFWCCVKTSADNEDGLAMSTCYEELLRKLYAANFF